MGFGTLLSEFENDVTAGGQKPLYIHEERDIGDQKETAALLTYYTICLDYLLLGILNMRQICPTLKPPPTGLL